MKEFRTMVRGEEENTWLANNRIGETAGIDDSGPSTRLISYAAHGTTPAATNFFDQEGAAYFGELEEALMHGVVGGLRKTEEETKPSYFTTRPPTLEIFPSWPMRLQQTPRGNSLSAAGAASTDSGSAQNTISQLESESTASRNQSADQRQQQGLVMASGSTRSATAPNHQSTTQEKRRGAGSTAAKDGKILDAKTLRRLAQNREAARKSRLRKKAYVQQLETSRVRLQQLEHDLHTARSQGLFLGAGVDSAGGAISSGAAVFEMEYARWLDDNNKHMSDLRNGLQAHLPDSHLNMIIEECINHCDELFRLKAMVEKTDVFHLLTGMWATPAERCFLWIGGFKPSELLKIMMPQLEPLTEQQLMGICNLQQSSHQAEEALSQGLDQLHESLSKTVAGESLNDGIDVGNYMGHMAVALSKLANLEGFIRQADNLRHQTLHQLWRILTIRQAARCLVAIGEYNTRLRALSSLWASRPREGLMANEIGACSATTNLQIIHQLPQNQFSPY